MPASRLPPAVKPRPASRAPRAVPDNASKSLRVRKDKGHGARSGSPGERARPPSCRKPEAGARRHAPAEVRQGGAACNRESGLGYSRLAHHAVCLCLPLCVDWFAVKYCMGVHIYIYIYIYMWNRQFFSVTFALLRCITVCVFACFLHLRRRIDGVHDVPTIRCRPGPGDPLWSLPAIRALVPEKCEL